jgi:DNA-binding MarR family transcriptional regulator
MHYLSLEMKRAHWAAVGVARSIAAEFWLTPARFDLLYVVRRFGGGSGQNAIARQLGVSGATVSRMLRSLEELGFVRRVRMSFDLRRKVIRLSSWAEEFIDRAIRAFVDGKVMHRIYQAMRDLGSKAIRAAKGAKTNAEARRAYEDARRKERQCVFEEMETLFNELQFTAGELRGTPTARVYDPPDRND